MAKVLFLAYNFPPCGGPSVQRSLKFIKYLPACGWQPVVIAAHENAYPIQDATLASDIPPETPVYRTPSGDIVAWQAAFRRRGLGKLHAALNTLLALPDSAFLWQWLARPAIRRAVAEHQPQAIYSSSGPYSAHLLGSWASRAFRLPWLADFRDPWSQNRIVRYPPGYRALNRRMEAGVLKTAHRVVTVSQPIAASLACLMLPRRSPVEVIPNGYDPQDVPFLAPERTAKLTITYTGKFTHLRRPDALLEAVTRLTASGEIPLENIELVFAGSNMDAFVPNRAPFVKLGYVAHTELPALWRRSDLLLLVQDPAPESAGDYSAKLFEYLAANRPILAITSADTVAAELIRQTRSGVIAPHDPAALRPLLLQFYRDWQAGGLAHQPDWPLIRQYSRPQQAARLGHLLDEMTQPQ